MKCLLPFGLVWHCSLGLLPTEPCCDPWRVLVLTKPYYPQCLCRCCSLCLTCFLFPFILQIAVQGCFLRKVSLPSFTRSYIPEYSFYALIALWLFLSNGPVTVEFYLPLFEL